MPFTVLADMLNGGAVPRIGLVGWDDPTGLGALNRDLARHVALARWVVLRRRQDWARALPTARGGCEVVKVWPGMDGSRVRNLLKGLDWLIFAENPVLPGLVENARRAGVRVACVPMWEWSNPDASWFDAVDLMICPTLKAMEVLLGWKRKKPRRWEVEYLPWPVDGSRFAFRERKVCRRFLYVNGNGGCRGRRKDGAATPYRRKGLEVVLEAARRLPGVPFLLRSQVGIEERLPANVEVIEGDFGPSALYEAGDVCLQPSRWEGIGLSLLECQAAGMPLVTTKAGPMTEFQPFRTVRAEHAETVFLEGRNPVPAHLVSGKDLSEVLEGIVGRDVSEASREARVFVEREHSWGRGVRVLRELLS